MTYTKPILVTGAPRSGTSWVGRIIEQVPSVRYVHEPFNISGTSCSCGVNFKYWFHYLSQENCHIFDEHIRHTIYPAYNRYGLLNSIKKTLQKRRIRVFLNYLQSYLLHRVVVKDPIAVFSAQTLANRFNMDVVVLIRHPAAVVNSYKSLNWTHPFSHFLHQQQLMKEQLGSFRSEIEDFAKNKYDIVDQVALLWKLIHYMIIKYRDTHSNWIFVKYSELVSEPIEGYRTIFEQLKLPFSDHIRTQIQSNSQQEPLSDITTPYSISRTPQLVITQWKKNLTAEEIHRIRIRVEDISSNFFSDEEWRI